MEDRTIMESILHTTKGVCDLYLHGTIESSTQNVNSAFTTALNDSLTMQNDIYQQMSSKGWYTADQAQEQQIAQVRQKFSNK
ncbi:MAG: spore coat protein [Ruminococcaceae bacterium]|nr:spore coat protein [Oscillospiraceae bacterium]